MQYKFCLSFGFKDSDQDILKSGFAIDLEDVEDNPCL